MEKIKIGNDIAITWKLYVYSAAGLGTLDKSQIRIFVKNEYDTLEIVDFSLEDNVVSFIFKAEMQTRIGIYELELTDRTEGVRNICEPNAFALVSHSTEEAGDTEKNDKDGNYIVKLSSNVLTVKGVSSDAAIYARIVALEKRITEHDSCPNTPITNEEIDEIFN